MKISRINTPCSTLAVSRTTIFCERRLEKLLKKIGQLCLILGVGFMLYFFSIAEFDDSFKYKEVFRQIASVDYSEISMNDVANYTKNAFLSAKENIPEAAAAMAQMATSGDEFGQPIDENPTQVVTPVFSVQGGTVIETGTSDKLGNYIIVSHAKGAQSVYGNCSNVYVQKLERVKKGQIIAEFNTETGADFCYSLVTNETNTPLSHP